jgi:hypothetical protein
MRSWNSSNRGDSSLSIKTALSRPQISRASYYVFEKTSVAADTQHQMQGGIRRASWSPHGAGNRRRADASATFCISRYNVEVMKGALLFGFLVMVAQCWAGHYDVSFSGGTCHSMGDYGDHSWPYAAVAGGWGGTAPTGGSAQGGPIGPGTGDCTGQITTTFTWNNDGDPSSLPPEAVIIKQTSSASWDGDSGSCADGLGDPAVPSSGGQTSSGIHWIARTNP